MRGPVHLFDDRDCIEFESKKQALKALKKLRKAIKSGEIEVTHMRHESGRLMDEYNNNGYMQAYPAGPFRTELAFRFYETPKAKA